MTKVYQEVRFVQGKHVEIGFWIPADYRFTGGYLKKEKSMARDRTIKISGINIRVHSKHDPSEYVSLWNSFYRMKRAKTRGLAALMIGTQRQIFQQDPLSPVFGYFYRFANINPDDPWFDIEKHKPAEDEDVAQVNIPKQLRPNLQEIPYLFNVRKHRLYFKSGGTDGGISPQSVQALVEQLSLNPHIKSRYGDVDSTIISERGLLKVLLAWPVIKQIDVVLKRPNPTEFEDDEEFYERLRRRGIKQEEHKFIKAPEAETITPDEEMIAMFNRAIEDGVYSQRGDDGEGLIKTASSKSYPFEEVVKYDPDGEIESEIFIQAASKL